jgi:hypothetical protein
MRPYPLRLVLLTLASVLVAAPPAHAQITLTANSVPFQLGTAPYASSSASGEEGDNEAAIAALVALSGPNRVYDFTALTFTESVTGEITVVAGATGPGAEESPLDQATLTAIFPFRVEDDEEEEPIEGTAYLYNRITAQAAIDLGLVVVMADEEESVVFSSVNLPSGATWAPASYTFGSTWSNTFTQRVNFGGFPFDSAVQQTYEVDGWGSLRVPGVEAVPALRVKLTETRTFFGTPITSVSYEFRTGTTLTATLFPADTFGPGSAEVARMGSGGTSAEPEASLPDRLALSAPHPNPFAGATGFEVALPQGERLRVSVHDVLGREVALLTDAPWPSGRHAFTFDGGSLPSGIYVVRVQAGQQASARRVTLLR